MVVARLKTVHQQLRTRSIKGGKAPRERSKSVSVGKWPGREKERTADDNEAYQKSLMQKQTPEWMGTKRWEQARAEESEQSVIKTKVDQTDTSPDDPTDGVRLHLGTI